MTLTQLLSRGAVILDGATGSNLMKAGMPRGVCAETWNLEHPQHIRALQKAYVEAGTQILSAPTFTANEYYLAAHGLDRELEMLNSKLVELSRTAAGENTLVFGDMTTLGKADIPYEQLLAVYSRQAKAIAKAGADGIIVETMMGLDETMAALEACKMETQLPIFCSFSVTADGMLYFGGNVFDACRQLAEFGADAVGINCSCGPDQLVSVIKNLADTTDVPIIAKPNAGMPVIDEQGNAVYSMEPDAFGRDMKALYDAGAGILGGCCGTDPRYIRALCRQVL